MNGFRKISEPPDVGSYTGLDFPILRDFDVGKAQVDILPADGLVAVNGDEVPARFDGGFG